MEWTSRSQRNDSVVKSNVSVIASSLVKDQLYLSVAVYRKYSYLTISILLYVSQASTKLCLLNIMIVQDKLYLFSKIMTVERFNGIKQSVLKASLKRLALIWVFNPKVRFLKYSTLSITPSRICWQQWNNY